MYAGEGKAKIFSDDDNDVKGNCRIAGLLM